MKKALLISALVCSFSLKVSAMDQVTVKDKTFKVSISRKKIKNRLKELGQKITADYAGKKPTFVCVLNGGLFFTADLMREVNLPCQMDTVKIASYEGLKSSGTITLSKGPSESLEGRDVIIVEDIVDTGESIKFLKKILKEHNPASMRVATLLHKNTVSELEEPLEYVGFEIKPEFVVGYCLDYDQEARNLPDIYTLVTE